MYHRLLLLLMIDLTLLFLGLEKEAVKVEPGIHDTVHTVEFNICKGLSSPQLIFWDKYGCVIDWRYMNMKVEIFRDRIKFVDSVDNVKRIVLFKKRIFTTTNCDPERANADMYPVYNRIRLTKPND